MLEDVFGKLKRVGITDGEIKVYLAALERGPSKATELADAAGLSRPAVYAAIEKLAGRGLMTSTDRKRSSVHTAEHPSRLVRYAERRSRDLQEIASDLSGVVGMLEMRAGRGKPAVKMYEGDEAIVDVVMDVLGSEEGTVREVVDLDALVGHLPEGELERLFDGLRSTGCRSAGIYAGDESVVSRYRLEDAAFLPPEESGFGCVIGLLSDRIVFVSLDDRPHAVVVESEPFVRALHALFGHAHSGLKGRGNGSL